MTLFPRYENSDDEYLGVSDAASRALSVTAIEHDFVERVYRKMASVYDVFFGLSLHHGRLTAIQRMGIKRGDRILEVGTGTGFNIAFYHLLMSKKNCSRFMWGMLPNMDTKNCGHVG